MAKTRQVLSFCDMGKCYKVIKYYGTTNPYRIYHYYNDYNKHGVLTEHRKLMESYGNLVSCFYWFIQNNIGY
jgi:hypothetical protein